VSKPVLYKFEPFALNSINTDPTLLLVSEQARRLKDLEVPRCRWPSALENRRNLPGSHGTAVEINREQHAAPGSVCQRAKHRLIYVDSRSRNSLHGYANNI
jgi:hypothetical protein